MFNNLFSSSHPPLPPTTEETQLLWLRLLRSHRVGPKTFYRLMRENNWDAASALNSLPDIAHAAGIDKYTPYCIEKAQNEYRAAHAFGARMLAYGMKHYPAALADIDDAPPILWVRGHVHLMQRPMVAIVGARNASSAGVRMARTLAEGLGDGGVTVVSGLARGIDTAAHKASLNAGTLAVQAGGVDIVYPPENMALAKDIYAKGLMVSEHPIGMQPRARHFPLRNRIIAGLSRIVIVVEAAAKSGSLITAQYAADQGRDVLAVPGHPFDGRATGTNNLIRDGAILVRNINDVLDVLKNLPQMGAPIAQMDDADAHQYAFCDTTSSYDHTHTQMNKDPVNRADGAGDADQDRARNLGGLGAGNVKNAGDTEPPKRDLRSRVGAGNAKNAGNAETVKRVSTSTQGVGNVKNAGNTEDPNDAGNANHNVRQGCYNSASYSGVKSDIQKPNGVHVPCDVYHAQSDTMAGTGADTMSDTMAGTGAKTTASKGGMRQQILDCLSMAPICEDQLIRDIGSSAQSVSVHLTELELSGRVERYPGGQIVLTSP